MLLGLIEPLIAAPDRQAYLLRKVSMCRGGARVTLGTAGVDGSDGQGIDALADVTGGDPPADDGGSVAATPASSRTKGGVTRATGASRGGRRRHSGHGDQGDSRGRDAPDVDGDDENPDDQPFTTA